MQTPTIYCEWGQTSTTEEEIYLNTQRKLRNEILYLNLRTKELRSKIVTRKVSDDESLSNHKYILFQLAQRKCAASKITKPRNTLWDLYRKELKIKLVELLTSYGTIVQLEHAAEFLLRDLVLPYEIYSLTSTLKSRKGGKL